MNSIGCLARTAAVVSVLALGAACAEQPAPAPPPANAAPTEAEPATFGPGFYPTPNAEAPLVDGDPGAAVATKVREEHRVTLATTPGYLGTAISQHNGHTVIVIFTDEPVPKSERIKQLGGIPLFYSLGGQLITEAPRV